MPEKDFGYPSGYNTEDHEFGSVDESFEDTDGSGLELTPEGAAILGNGDFDDPKTQAFLYFDEREADYFGDEQ